MEKLFFTAGTTYRCIRDVVLTKGGKPSFKFKAGNVYEQTEPATKWYGWLTNEHGERHSWPQPWYAEHEANIWNTPVELMDPRNYFEPVTN